ncbi:hypothetical protein SB775_24920 [Peribacillus sp. SIMBA_075]|nr:hypothetical protein [Peribacillus sp. TH16]
MKHLFFTPEGLKIIFSTLVVLLDCIIFGNTIAGVSGKENRFT